MGTRPPASCDWWGTETGTICLSVSRQGTGGWDLWISAARFQTLMSTFYVETINLARVGTLVSLSGQARSWGCLTCQCRRRKAWSHHSTWLCWPCWRTRRRSRRSRRRIVAGSWFSSQPFQLSHFPRRLLQGSWWNSDIMEDEGVQDIGVVKRGIFLQVHLYLLEGVLL